MINNKGYLPNSYFSPFLYISSAVVLFIADTNWLNSTLKLQACPPFQWSTCALFKWSFLNNIIFYTFSLHVNASWRQNIKNIEMLFCQDTKAVKFHPEFWSNCTPYFSNVFYYSLHSYPTHRHHLSNTLMHLSKSYSNYHSSLN